MAQPLLRGQGKQPDFTIRTEFSLRVLAAMNNSVAILTTDSDPINHIVHMQLLDLIVLNVQALRCLLLPMCHACRLHPTIVLNLQSLRCLLLPMCHAGRLHPTSHAHTHTHTLWACDQSCVRPPRFEQCVLAPPLPILRHPRSRSERMRMPLAMSSRSQHRHTPLARASTCMRDMGLCLCRLARTGCHAHPEIPALTPTRGSRSAHNTSERMHLDKST